MKHSVFIAFLLAMTAAWAGSMPQEHSASGTVPVTIVVSVEAKHGKEIPALYREDVRVFQGHDRLQVTEWVPLQGAQAGLELFILIDDSCDPGVGSQLQDVQKFVNAQPDTTAIGIGYIRNSTVDIAQNFTKNHAQAAKAIRLPMGTSASTSSPYIAVSDLIKGWNDTGNRRIILMVSSGIDGLQDSPTDTYLEDAITVAQRNNVRVFTIYGSTRGHPAHSFWRSNIAQSNLSQLTDETGGESYFQGLQTPLSYEPFLADFSNHLNHQYKLTFLAKAGDKPSDEHIRLETEVPNAEVVGPDRVRIPAAK